MNTRSAFGIGLGVLLLLVVWVVLSGFFVDLSPPGFGQMWMALTAIGTLALAAATFFTLWRDRGLRRLERTPNIIIQRGEIVLAQDERQTPDPITLADCEVRFHVYNLGKYPVFITRLRFVYFWADVVEKRLFKCHVGEHVGANERKLIQFRFDEQYEDERLLSNGAMYVDVLYGASGPQEWTIMTPIGSPHSLPIDLGPEQTHPKEIAPGFYGDEYLFG